MASESARPFARDRVRRLLLWVIALTTLLWPMLPMAGARFDERLPIGIQLLRWLVVLAATLAVAGAVHALVRRRFATVVGVFVGVYATFVVILSLYRLSMHDWLDVGFVLAMPADSVKTAYNSLGPSRTAGTAAGLVVHTALYALSFGFIGRAVATLRPAVRGAAVVLTLVPFFLIRAPHDVLVLETSERERTAVIKPALPRVPYTITPGESLFIVQLESLNAIAGNGEYGIGDPNGIGANAMMRELGKQGIYFPYVWSHDVQTHRAQQSILCGSVRNLQPKSIFDQGVADRPCMPQLFRDAGYRTVFLSSYTDPHFAKTRDIARHSGFADIHFADYMKKGDPKAVWGYEENVFFRRSFEYLRSKYRPDERLFVFFVVTAHHVGFTRGLSDDTAWFVDERDVQLAKYFDSARKQDASLATFWRELLAFTGGRAHLIVTGDHSYPLGLYGSIVTNIGSSVDNFLTSMVYVPPKHRAGEFALGKVMTDIPGHSDLLPTIAELVSGKPHANSLLPFMLRNPPPAYDYEPCQVMVQPFDTPAVTIARGEKMYTYRFMSECYQEYDITRSPLRQKRGKETCGVTFEEFDRRLGCRRYRAQ